MLPRVETDRAAYLRVRPNNLRRGAGHHEIDRGTAYHTAISTATSGTYVLSLV